VKRMYTQTSGKSSQPADKWKEDKKNCQHTINPTNIFSPFRWERCFKATRSRDGLDRYSWHDG
jgi:hypothetical protein